MMLPMWLIKQRVLQPMLLGTRGTLLAADACLESGIAVNFSGGYHHASRDKGEGFCLISDIALAVEHLKAKGIVSSEHKAMIIDLDAHQGNGYERIYQTGDYVYIVDMYNREIYPGDEQAKRSIDYSIGLKSGTNSEEYLRLVSHHLPQAFTKAQNPAVVIYIAGTDIYSHDQLGRLNVSPDGIFERDRLVLDMCLQHHIPCIMLPGGGYSSESYKMIARTVDYLIRTMP
jgi:histone deacetylase 11